MSTRNIGVRLSVRDGERVKAELKALGQEGQRALELIEKGAQPASAGLKVVDNVAADLGGRMDALGGQAGIAGSALRGLGPAGAAAAAALGAVVGTLTLGLREASQNERAFLRLEQVLTRTGRAAGQTAGQIRALAQEQAGLTFFSERELLEAAASLATFPSIGGDEFRGALQAAQDLSAIYGGSLLANIESVGRALEDPIAGFQRLRQQGFALTEQQRELVESFIAVGDTAAAQRIVLESLNEVIAGASQAEAGGLAGAAKQARDEIAALAEKMAIATGAGDLLEGVLRRTASAARGWRSIIDDLTDGGDVGRTVIRLTNQLIEAEDRLAAAADQRGPMAIRRARTARAEIAELERRIEAVVERGRRESEAIREAELGRAEALLEQRTQQGFDRLRELQSELEGLATPGERLDAINASLSETVTQLERLRTEGNSAAIDDAIRAAREIAERRIEAIERPAREAAEREAGRTRDLIDGLAGSLERFGNERAEFVERYLSRLGESASPEERARVEALANSLFDLQQSRRSAAGADRDGQRIAAEGEAITRSVRTATEEYIETLETLNRLLGAGAITQETYSRAAERAAERLATLQRTEARRRLTLASDPLSGAIRALETYAERAGTIADTIEQSLSRAFSGAEDAVRQFVSTGKLEFGSLVRSILADLAVLSIRQAVLGPLARALGGALGSGGGLFAGLANVIAGVFHEGGRVGAAGATRMVPAAAFAGAPRFHGGGGFGLKPDEQAAILQRGERVLNRRETRDWEAGGGTTVVINARDAESFRASQAQIAADIARAVGFGRRGL